MTTPIVPSISDELIEELEAIQRDASFVTRETDSQEYLGNLAARTLASLRAAEADAKRYRWIREQHNDVTGRTWVAVYQPGEWVSLDAFLAGNKVETLDLDSAVDKAMELDK